MDNRSKMLPGSIGKDERVMKKRILQCLSLLLCAALLAVPAAAADTETAAADL